MPSPGPLAETLETTLERELAPTPSPAAVEGDDPGLASPPPLAGLATLAALLDLLVNQVAVRLLPAATVRSERLAWMTAGELMRNGAALAAAIALATLLWDLLRRRRWAPPMRRLVIASFGGLFLPSVALALVLPHARVEKFVVMMGIGSGTVLAALLALVPLRFRSPGLLRIGLGALGMGTLLAFVALVLRLSTFGAATTAAQEGVRQAGEGLHLAALGLVGLAFAPVPLRRLRNAAAATSGVAVAAAVGLALAWAVGRLGPDFGGFFYGVQRLTLWLEETPLVYAALLGPFAGLAVAAALSADPARRQGGLALLLVLRAGYAPRSIAAVLSLALAAGLAARAALVLAARQGRAESARRIGANGRGRVAHPPDDDDDRLSSGAPPPPRSA